MSDEVEEEEGEAKGGKGKLIIIAVAALLLLGGGGGAAAYFLGLFDSSEEVAAADEHGEEGDHGEAETAHADGAAPEVPEEPSDVVFVQMPDILVNLQTDGKRMRFLKLKVALEAASEEVAQRVEALTPRIMDSFQMYLRALTVDEIRGSSGMLRLKEELVARINHAVAPSRIDDILVKEMLVQ